MAEVAEAPSPVPHRTVEGLVMSVPSMVAVMLVLASTLAGGSWALAQAAADIDANTEKIKAIEAVQTTAVADVKRGIGDNADAINAISIKFDLLLNELVIREVVRDRPTPPPTN